MHLIRQVLTFLLIIASVFTPVFAKGAADPGRPTDYFAPEILDKPLGVERLPNGNTLITDAGGAYYTTTDSSIIEVDPQGNVVWTYSGDLRFAHTARPTAAGTLLVTDTTNDRVIQINRAGEIVWTTDDWGNGTGTLSDGSHLFYPNNAEELENGNFLFTDRNNDRVFEVTPDGEVMWTYDELIRPHNAHRLPNGNTMISDSESNIIIEVNTAGEIVWTFGGGPALNWPRNGERLDNGNTLITDSRGGRVLEVDAAGETVWQYSGLALPFEAHRLDNGNTLIADNNHRRTIEVTPEGHIVWEFRNLPEDIQTTLHNGDFELDSDDNGLPDGWYPADLNAEGIGTFIWDGVERVTGQRSASLEYHEGGRLAWLQTVRVEAGQTYQFEGWLKAQIQGGAFAFQLWFVDEMGGPLGDTPIIGAAYNRSIDWTHAAIDVTAPGDAVAVQIWIISRADGRIWADDLSLTPASNAATSPGVGGWVGAIGIVLLLGVIAILAYRRRVQSGGPIDS